MTATFKKLNFKDRKEIYILNSPSEFSKEHYKMKKVYSVKTNIKEANDLEFILLFVQTKNEIDEITPIMNQKLKGDGTVWFAYPKRSSKKYTSEISRD